MILPYPVRNIPPVIQFHRHFNDLLIFIDISQPIFNVLIQFFQSFTTNNYLIIFRNPPISIMIQVKTYSLHKKINYVLGAGGTIPWWNSHAMNQPIGMMITANMKA